MQYVQHFNHYSKDYQQFRPTYPRALFEFILSITPIRQQAWDCATGNGQAALALAPYFQHVVASDINESQLSVADAKENVTYACFSAEKTTLADKSVDLITVAQAMHWFALDDFYAEVKRVAKVGATLAAWSYSLCQVDSGPIDRVVTYLYDDILGDQYWPKERRYIDDRYETIPFPFQKILTPQFTIEKTFDLMTFMGYLNTWSALKEFEKQNQYNAFDTIKDELAAAWGDAKQQRVVRWPLYLLAAKVS